jgi:hypothetical protein
MRLDVARSVRRCHDLIASHIAEHGDCRVALFALRQPAMRSILRRIQTMSRTTYGDIHANLMDIDVFPIHLLRCKLSFFGVSKFDPRSRMWVRNTMFQGAPIAADIGDPFADDWCFPVMPIRGRPINVSISELSSLLKRSFEGLGFNQGDYEDTASAALWLECHGLGGLDTVRRAWPRLQKHTQLSATRAR